MIADDPPRIRLKLLEYFGKAEYRGVNIKYFSSANNRSLVNAYIKGETLESLELIPWSLLLDHTT